MTHRVYDLIRSLVEQLGGSMTYERQKYRYGAWVITLGEKRKVIEAGGNRSFPELDQLLEPLVPNPRHWDDYKNQLVPDAIGRLFALMGFSDIPENEMEDFKQLIERNRWKFAWTYARIYPHEYTTKALCNLEDHARLIDCIERYGIIQRFWDSQRKYFYFEDRKYWHMGEPFSDDPEKWPNVINRTWLDVRRHAENVRHRWTPEEVELQQRLWEIQLEKATAAKKPTRKSKTHPRQE